MKTTKALVVKYYRTRSALYRLRRLYFPSPAEIRLIRLMGGKVWVAKKMHWPNGYPLALVISMGRLFKSERVKREVRVGRYYLDFGNDIWRGIEVDGAAYHRDVVAAFDRDSYLYMRGWMVMHVPAIKLWLEPDRVQREVLWFLTK